MALKVRTTGGEGETARDALEALAHGLRDEEVGDQMVIHLKRSTIRKLGSDDTYEGFAATVQRE